MLRAIRQWWWHFGAVRVHNLEQRKHYLNSKLRKDLKRAKARSAKRITELMRKTIVEAVDAPKEGAQT